MKPVAVVTGGSSGLGMETASALVTRGYTVYELSRRESCHPPVVHISTDITDSAAVTSALETVFKNEGRLDLLVNNAGFGISGAAEFTPVSEVKRLFDVNFFGTVAVTNAAVPYIRRTGGGRIVFVSSFAAVVAIPFQAFYSAGKAAINSYSMCLANELKPFGITVTAVMPGDSKTGFTAVRDHLAAGDDIYGGVIARSVGRMEKDEQNGVPASIVGGYIARIATKKKVKPLYVQGTGYKLLSVLVKLLPSGLVNRIIGGMYAS